MSEPRAVLVQDCGGYEVYDLVVNGAPVNRADLLKPSGPGPWELYCCWNRAGNIELGWRLTAAKRPGS